MAEFQGKILAVILNWNQLDYTTRCLDSLYAQEGIEFDTLLVDNNSCCFSPEKLKGVYADLGIIELSENKGVAGGRNEGLKFALKHRYDYVLFLDNDAYADKKMIHELIISFYQGESIGIAGPKIYRDGEKNVVWRAGCLSWRATYLYSFFSILKKIFNFLNKPIPPEWDVSRGDGHLDIGQFDEGRDIDFQIGCAQMIKVDLARTIGMLDERFSPYGSEDIDYCERTKAAGWTIRYAPKAVCWHTIESGPSADPKRTFYNLKHLLLLARKHLGKKEMFFCFLPDFFLLHLPLVFADSILKGKACSSAVVRAINWHLMNIEKEGLFLR